MEFHDDHLSPDLDERGSRSWRSRAFNEGRRDFDLDTHDWILKAVVDTRW